MAFHIHLLSFLLEWKHFKMGLSLYLCSSQWRAILTKVLPWFLQGTFENFFLFLRDSKMAFFLVEKKHLAVTLHSCLHMPQQSSHRSLQTWRKVIAAPTRTEGYGFPDAGAVGWQGMCSMDLSCQTLQAPFSLSHDVLLQVSVLVCAQSLRVGLSWPSHPQITARAKRAWGTEAKSVCVYCVLCAWGSSQSWFLCALEKGAGGLPWMWAFSGEN